MTWKNKFHFLYDILIVVDSINVLGTIVEIFLILNLAIVISVKAINYRHTKLINP
jgi:hypothetical protein